MKKFILRILAVLVLASAVTSCSVEYREHHPHHWDRDHDHDDYH
ncbi:hypothetical protein HDF24_10705 [Mucilaginibacter sp. X4EP1]|nr:hypothetical protein [Mucilaginibacter sp. X4EP1]MCS3815633.1 hypothetical protein [Mucilaginibacter sp. X4EP1]